MVTFGAGLLAGHGEPMLLSRHELVPLVLKVLSDQR